MRKGERLERYDRSLLKAAEELAAAWLSGEGPKSADVYNSLTSCQKVRFFDVLMEVVYLAFLFPQTQDLLLRRFRWLIVH